MDGDTRRTRLANERTYLAWWRTSLGCIGVGLGIGRGLAAIEADTTRWPYTAIGIVFVLLGAGAAVYGGWRFHAVERDVEPGEPTRPVEVPLAVGTFVLVVLGLASAGLLLFS
ncbi:MAG: DUF202 domain-containing protein [Solirubrobacteraceae bacterium]|nr:DUF202 domain-containing protein [Solirubrobacteraceae bacterium]